MPARYDLHTHSVHSDGTTTPAEIASEAHQLGLAGFALTDHDTTEGWAEGRQASAALGLDFLPGMEITTRHAHRSTHLLAYGFDPTSGELLRELTRVRESRVGRAKEMVRRLSADFDIDWFSVIEGGEDRTFGRPHIADALVAAGHYPDRGAAFSEVLHPRSPYYVGTYAIETADAVRLVREAGGVPVLAHPAAARQTRAVDPEALAAFVKAGLWGIELRHPENREDWLPPLEKLAEKYGLHVTGASDYHGAGKANRLGERTSDESTWQAIRALAAVPS